MKVLNAYQVIYEEVLNCQGNFQLMLEQSHNAHVYFQLIHFCIEHVHFPGLQCHITDMPTSHLNASQNEHVHLLSDCIT
jgi:hypothetical protein